jgi:hypothetical protein
MAIPSSNPVLFPPVTGQFTVSSITTGTVPGGTAVGTSIDLDPGFLVSGSVSVPDWLPGSGVATGQVCLYADELGGPFNDSIGCVDVSFSVVTPSDPSKLVEVDWQIPVTALSSGLPDPQPSASQLYHLAAVFNYGSQLTDIAAFVDLGIYMII